MAIEFIEQPPKKVGDIKRDDALEHTGVGFYPEYGYDPMWINFGRQDTAAVFANILQYAAKTDVIDFETMKAMMYDVAQDLEAGRRGSYIRGIDVYIADMIRIGQEAAETAG